MSLLQFFTWCNETAVSVAVRDSAWLLPVVQIFHLLSLAVLGGAVLVVDLRLSGLGLRTVPISTLAREVAPWMHASVAVVLLSGVALFLSEALRCYSNQAFWVKMGLLLLALIFTYGVRPRWTHPVATPRIGGRVVAVVSVALWTGVAAAGRGIAFW